MSADQIAEFFRQFSEECSKRPELEGQIHPEISIGWNPSFKNELVLTIHWWDKAREEKRNFSVIYPKSDWRDGMSGLLDDLLSRSIARKPRQPRHSVG